MKNFFRHFIPKYDELTLFVMSLACILIFIANIAVIRMTGGGQYDEYGASYYIV